VRIAEGSGVHVVGINVSSEADRFGERGLGLPQRNLRGVLSSKRNRKAGEFIILEIKVVQLSLPGPVNFKGPNNVHRTVEGHVLFGKLEVLSHLLALSNGSRLIELVFVRKRMKPVNGNLLDSLGWLSWDRRNGLWPLFWLFWIDIVINLFTSWR